jgi:hypothetical protein
MASKLYTFNIHRNRPMIEALENAAGWLQMDYIGGLLFIAREYGLRGLFVNQRRSLLYSDGWRDYLAESAHWLAEDIAHIPSALLGHMMGLRLRRWLISAMLSEPKQVGESILPLHKAKDEITRILEPDTAAQWDRWAAERKAKQAADDAAALAELDSKPCEPHHVAVLLDLWAEMSTEARLECVPYLLRSAMYHGQSVADGDSYVVQFWHSLGATEEVIELITDQYPDEISARRLFADWRSRGQHLRWMAAHYEPLVLARIKPAPSDGGSDTTYSDLIEAA